MAHRDWLGLKEELPERLRLILTIFSFLLPLAVWCAVSYLPFLWHPLDPRHGPGKRGIFRGRDGGAERGVRAVSLKSARRRRRCLRGDIG